MLLLHATTFINFLAHVWGSRRYGTGDGSRNDAWLALVTLGEGWYNNHHHCMSSSRQGFFSWKIDASDWMLRLLARLGLVWDLREPPAAVLREGLRWAA